MTKDFVKTDDLRKLYGEQLPLSLNFNGDVKTTTLGLLERYPIKVVQRNGPYSIVRSNRLLNSSSFIVPSEVIITETAPPLKEWLSARLEQLVPGRFVVQNSGSYVYVYIHYPELTITNTTGCTHTMYDFIVRIALLQSGSFNALSGTRLSYSPVEWHKSYCHSHIDGIPRQSDGCIVFKDFCRGSSSTGFNRYLTSITNVDLMEDDVEILLNQVEAFLSWESLEGKPYKSLNTLYSSNEYQPNQLLSNSLVDELSDSINICITGDLTKYSTLFRVVDNILVLDPTINSDLGLDLEMQLLNLVPLRENMLHNYDLITNTYRSSNQSYTRPASLRFTPELFNVIDKLGVTPRIIETQSNTTETGDIIKRLSQDDFFAVVRHYNDSLFNKQFYRG